MGRKKIAIDLSELERLAGLGLTQDEICAQLGFSVDTLENRVKESSDFSDAIKRGKAQAAETVSNKLMELCRRGNLGAIIWYEKTRRGLSDRFEVRDWREDARRDGVDPEQVFRDMVEAAKKRLAGTGGGGSDRDGEAGTSISADSAADPLAGDVSQQ